MKKNNDLQNYIFSCLDKVCCGKIIIKEIYKKDIFSFYKLNESKDCLLNIKNITKSLCNKINKEIERIKKEKSIEFSYTYIMHNETYSIKLQGDIIQSIDCSIIYY